MLNPTQIANLEFIKTEEVEIIRTKRGIHARRKTNKRRTISKIKKDS